ncbi:MAG: helix-turn-helix transcriptional regulator [Bdellovibrionaceae bacterium]|nr:helix-turn-helix transcriptional regulator [Pseudobdellovibrionaceae bacterium]
MAGNKSVSITSGIDKYELPQRLEYLRGRRNMTQQELAKVAGISQSTVAQIESGKKDPSLSTLKKVAQALDVHIAVLFSSDDVHVFDMARLKKKYDHVDKLNPTIFYALGRVMQYAREIGFL